MTPTPTPPTPPPSADWRAVARASTDPFDLRVCLLGPTGVGKTARVRDFAAEAGLPLVHLDLHGLPEDILGLPRVVRGRTEYSRPEWLVTDRPVVLFLDELDKCRQEVLDVTLTLLAEGRVRDISMHPATIIIAAMQPVDPTEFLATQTGMAVANRLWFVPLTYDRERLARVTGVSRLTELPTPPLPTPPVLPVPTDKAVEWALRMYVRHGLDVFRGAFSPEWAAFLREAANEPVAPTYLYDLLATAERWDAVDARLRASLTPAAAVDVVRHVAARMHSGVLAHVIVRALDGAAEDEQQLLWVALNQALEDSDGVLCASESTEMVTYNLGTVLAAWAEQQPGKATK